MFPDVPESCVAKGDDPYPAQEAGGGGSCHEHQPEPQEDVDLLVEEVDRQHALYGMSVHVTSHLTHSEVTQCHAWEHTRCRPIATEYQVRDDVKSVQMIVCAQKTIQ